MGNITKAAQELGYTQARVSQIINHLEEELGVPVFTRSRTGIQVLPKARSLLEKMEKTIQAEDELLKAAKSISALDNNTIRICSFGSFIRNLLPGLMSGFMEIYPHIVFKVQEYEEYVYIARQVMNNEADIAFVVQQNFEQFEQFEFLPLIKDAYVVVMPQGHPLSEEEEIDIQQLRKYQFIVPNEGLNNEILCEVIQTCKTVSNFEGKLLNDSMTIGLVEKGWGISIIPELFMRNVGAKIVRRPLKGDYYRVIGMGTKLTADVSPAGRKFIRFVKDYYK